MAVDDRRVLRLAGVRNLRDVGGYPTTDGRCTRWRTLYRSDCLDCLDAAGQSWLVEAGLRSVIDIRGEPEVAERPNVFAASREVDYRHFPLFRAPPPEGFEPDLRRGYRREVDILGEQFAALVADLVQPHRLPALVHCAAGKDRTGLVIAILLAAVGTQRRAIAEDYALSEVCLGPSYLAEVREWVDRLGWSWSAWEHTAYTPPERMLETLAYIDERYGGVAQYLGAHGLEPGALGKLREALTESCPDAAR